MVKLGTSCKECYNFNSESKTCSRELYDIFLNRNAEITFLEDDVTIDRICPHKNTTDSPNEDPYIFGTIILLVDNKDSLKSALEEINKNERIENFKILILYKDLKYHDLLPLCIENIHSSYRLVYMVTNDVAFQVYKSLGFAKNGLLFIIDTNKEIEPNMIDKVNHLINNKLYRVLHIHNNNEIHQSVSMVHLYKWIKGDLGESMAFKLKDISENEQSDPQIYTWKEVNEQYSN